jgi:hypothetical protein
VSTGIDLEIGGFGNLKMSVVLKEITILNINS